MILNNCYFWILGRKKLRVRISKNDKSDINMNIGEFLEWNVVEVNGRGVWKLIVVYIVC